MKASLVKKAIEAAMKSKRPVFLWGSPGIGKSEVLRQVAKHHEKELIDVRVGQMDPMDVRGCMYLDKKNEAKWSRPSFFPVDGGPNAIMVLEEMNTAPMSVQAVTYQLVLDKQIGDYKLHDDCFIVACGNLETDKAVTSRMSTALANRLIHITMEVDLEDWVAWALKAEIRTEIIAFMRFRPGLLHNFEPKAKEKAFPSPRSWEYLSNMMDGEPPKELEYELCAGTVGEGAAAEYIAFLRIFRELPSREKILHDPDKAIVPTDPATMYAVCGALSAVASEQNFGQICKYAFRIPAEFSVLLIRDCVKRDEVLLNTRAFIEWASKNGSVLI